MVNPRSMSPRRAGTGLTAHPSLRPARSSGTRRIGLDESSSARPGPGWQLPARVGTSSGWVRSARRDRTAPGGPRAPRALPSRSWRTAHRRQGPVSGCQAPARRQSTAGLHRRQIRRDASVIAGRSSPTTPQPGLPSTRHEFVCFLGYGGGIRLPCAGGNAARPRSRMPCWPLGESQRVERDRHRLTFQ
jgi:hypothetical protein